MKFLHLSDLHLGKRLNGFSLLEDQSHILTQILQTAAAESPDAVLIAGDVYDRSDPSAEAVALFDDFLFRLSRAVPHVFAISGNHDSPERLAFASRLLEPSGVHLAPVYSGTVAPTVLTDAHGPVRIYLLPFLRPAQARRFFPEAEVSSYTGALRAALAQMAPDPGLRNVLVTHQFVAGSARCESEELSAGGTDAVDAALFDAFDYVALGHLHSPQSVLRDTLRYCGTPLKYSFSEADQQKSVTIAELGEKGRTSVRTIPLTPLRDLRELRGTYLELTARSFYQDTATGDYLHITLTDEEDVPEALGRLRAVYPNLMKLDYDNRRTRESAPLEDAAAERLTPLELFSQFYETQNNQPLDDCQRRFLTDLIQELWEEDAP